MKNMTRIKEGNGREGYTPGKSLTITIHINLVYK